MAQARVDQWRKNVFENVKEQMTSKWLQKIQDVIGLWNKEKVELSLNPVIIHNLGMMTCQLPAQSANNEEKITLSIFLFLGEIRIGLFVPNNLLIDNQNLKEMFSRAIPNKKAVISAASDGDSTVFDFVFRNEWIAENDVMIKSLSDSLYLDAFADGISKQVQHVLMYTVFALHGVQNEQK